MGKQVGFHLDPKEATSMYSADNMENGRTRQTTPSKAKPGRKGRRDGAARRTVLAGSLVGALLVVAYLAFAGHTAYSVQTLSMSGMHGMHRFGDGTADTLIIYVYAHTDPEYAHNLRYFLEFGVRPDDGCDYLVVVQTGKGVLSTDLPPLPGNVRSVEHPNECFDWGTFGWAIDKKLADTSKYRYIIFLNSSVRGPFLPSYWPRDLHWSRVLTGRLNNEVKLVGATISCEGANLGGVLTGEMRRNPHVQSYVVATDQIGLELMQADGDVLKCYSSIYDAIWYAEVGSSAAILDAGYNIDALMLRYQGVDWRDKSNWGCNAGINPYAEYMYDGINISPFEVMFVKVKEFLLEANWTTATTAKKYSTWNKHEHKLADNEYNAKKAELRNMKILNMRARGSACFDFDFYRARNADLPVWGHETLWEHFVTSGQHEGRVFRFRCKPGAVEFPKPPPPPPRQSAPGTAIGKGKPIDTKAQAGAQHATGDVITAQQAAQVQKAAAAAAAQQAAQVQKAAAAAAAQQGQAAAAAQAQQQAAAQATGTGGAANGQRATAAAGAGNAQAQAQAVQQGAAGTAQQAAGTTVAAGANAAAVQQQAGAGAAGQAAGGGAAGSQQQAAAATHAGGAAGQAATQAAAGAATSTAHSAGAAAGQRTASAQQAAATAGAVQAGQGAAAAVAGQAAQQAVTVGTQQAAGAARVTAAGQTTAHVGGAAAAADAAQQQTAQAAAAAAAAQQAVVQQAAQGAAQQATAGAAAAHQASAGAAAATAQQATAGAGAAAAQQATAGAATAATAGTAAQQATAGQAVQGAQAQVAVGAGTGAGAAQAQAQQQQQQLAVQQLAQAQQAAAATVQ